ncbi:MAG TPA: sigma-54 dependent transcriptional regulator [Longimicrobiales bacterium]|nr:sigma-54 dependent transcriptional regulator [Longimicrobiales bacterium]
MPVFTPVESPRTAVSLDETQKSGIRILIVEDESTLRETCATMLGLQGYNVQATGKGEEALEWIQRREYDVMLLDLYMAHVPGMDILKAALTQRPETLAIMMTGNPSMASNVEALELGAWDYLPKPFSATHLELLIERAAYTVLQQRQGTPMPPPAGGRHRIAADQELPLIGNSPAFVGALELARKVARSNASVFLTGESGSGKELFAQFIHQHSRAAARPLVAINCAALPEPLLESEMFGHCKGAFTGAVRDRPGLFETADGGTLFLDELTEMSQAIQAKLLRVIQDGVVRRVGSSTADATVNVRFIAATNRDPAQAVREGRLRSDLYYRLRVVPIRVPPLRERGADIPLLADHFLKKFWERDYPREPAPHFGAGAIQALLTHTWPGNVRELQNVVEHTVVLAEPGSEIRADEVPFIAEDETGSGTLNSDLVRVRALTQPYHEAREQVLSDFERSYLVSLVDRAKGNMSRAARLAGVDRTTLYRLVEKHSLERDNSLRSR